MNALKIYQITNTIKHTNNKYYTTIQHSLHKYGIQNSLTPNSDKSVGSKIKIPSRIIFMP